MCVDVQIGGLGTVQMMCTVNLIKECMFLLKQLKELIVFIRSSNL